MLNNGINTLKSFGAWIPFFRKQPAEHPAMLSNFLTGIESDNDTSYSSLRIYLAKAHIIGGQTLLQKYIDDPVSIDTSDYIHRDHYHDLSNGIDDRIARLERGKAITDEFQRCSQYSYQDTDEDDKKEIQDTYGEDIFFDRDETDRGHYRPLTNQEMAHRLSKLFRRLTKE